MARFPAETNPAQLNEQVGRTVLSEEAYLRLLRAILTGRLPLGSKLNVRALATSLGLSATPIKTALAALEREGMVISVPNRGYFVRTMDRRDVTEVCQVRERLEGWGAGLAAERSDSKLVLKLRECIFQQDVCAKTQDFDGYADWDLEFHQRITDGSGNAMLASFASRLHGFTRLIVLKSWDGPRRISAVVKEHTQIVECIEARDAEGAERAMVIHIRNVHNALEDVVNRQVD